RAEVLPKGQSLARHRDDDLVRPTGQLAPRSPRPSSCVWRYRNGRPCPGLDQGSRPQGAVATRSLRLQCVYRRSELRHRLGSVPHAFEMDVELRCNAFVPDHAQIIVLRPLAARAEIRRSRAQYLSVDRIGLQVHERASALDPHVVREIAKLHEVVALTRVQYDPDRDAATLR